MQLTDHFSYEELTNSSTARRIGIKNTPTDEDCAHLRQLCEQILEPVRMAYGRPISVTSGYRCQRLNDMVKGSKTSQHLRGEAADIRAVSTTNAQLFHFIREMIDRGRLHVGQLIWEKGTETEPEWLHISLPRIGKPNNQILILI